MRKLLSSAFLTIVLLLPMQAAAWNATGHKTVAVIAYMNLKPGPKARVDALLRQHPDFRKLSRGLSPADPNFMMRVFARAAIWPDEIKGDNRFVEGDEPSPTDPRPEPGFPTMIRGRNWHFINVPFSPDGTTLLPPRRINALVKIDLFRNHIGNPRVFANIQAYELAWLLHLVGDIHQPLHSVARFTRQHRTGDKGGNDFKINDPDSDNLHSFWDGLLGKNDDDDVIMALATSIMNDVQLSRNALASSNTRSWIDESVAIARTFVYTIGREGNPQPSASDGYRTRAEKIARERAKLGGLRMAAMLNQSFR